MIFFTSDTHFGDSRVLRFDRRPFASMAEHDATLIALWNERVAPDDEIWHLGDVTSAHGLATTDLLARLHGRKHLVIGNNDPPAVVEADAWTSVQHYKEMIVDGHRLVLCHYPFRTWNQIGKKAINLHGHSHGRLKPMLRQFDVGVDARALQPVTLAMLLERRKPTPRPRS